jgi:hypothetical protein
VLQALIVCGADELCIFNVFFLWHADSSLMMPEDE